jgi:hypothetical protein
VMIKATSCSDCNNQFKVGIATSGVAATPIRIKKAVRKLCVVNPLPQWSDLVLQPG